MTLARDLADLLMELSLALGHQSAYPPGHPMLLAAAERLTHTLAVVLDSRETLTLGIARRQLVIDGVATDPRNALLGNLAQRLHRHRVAAARFERGIAGSEAAAMLRALSTDPRKDGPVGLLPEEERRWPHVQLYPARYGKLELRDGDGEADESPGVRLWLDLTRAALPLDGEAGTAGSNHPVVLAAAINRHGRDVTYDETVIRYLLQVADEVAVGESVEQAWLRRRLSRLIAALEPNALRRLLEVCGGSSGRRKFMLDASQTLAADAVVKLVQAAAATSERSISDSLMLLMGKFAQHSESAAPEAAAAADSALRENVERLVSDWDLEDPNPEAYSSVLHQMVRAGPREGPGIEFTLEPEQIVQIGLELDETGPRVHAAVERLVAEGRARVLSDLLEQAPHAG
ncbi:MAG: hypothetical protein ACREMX_01435, partial [Gemmatimonadales bacterium]